MPSIGAKGSASIYAMDGGRSEGSGILDTSTPAGWFHLFWIASVLIILFFLWAL